MILNLLYNGNESNDNNYSQVYVNGFNSMKK